MDFVHLHLHTEYSLLDGQCRIARLISAVKERGQKAVAITDHGNMYGAIEFYKAAKAEGIKPIIGCEVYVAPRSRFDKVKGPDSEYYHLLLLCRNEKGYQNLIKMVSAGYTEGFYSKPRIDKELLEEYHEGIIACSACLAGRIPRLLTESNYDGAKAEAQYMKKLFGEDSFYLELQNHGIREQQIINPQIIKMSEETGIPLVATNDVHYIEKDDFELQKVMVCVQTNHTINEPNEMLFKTNEFYLKSAEEMGILGFPESAYKNTVKIAEECNVEFEFGNIKLPYFDIGDKNHFDFFREKCYEGLYRHYGEKPSKTAIDRLEYELETINKMGYVDYYLIVQDYINYAKSVGIPVGPGRGSGAGSIAAYCIGITNIDPLKYDLLFERFLNPERVSMPDFDVDFCVLRREEVIQYVKRKYGEDHVAQIVTFGTMAARGAVRDVGRVLAVPYSTCDRIAKMIPMEHDASISGALKKVPELKAMYDSDSEIHRLIDIASHLEGTPRNTSTHAAGVVISDRPVSDYVPLATNDGVIVTQYTMTALDPLGLLKMDFLGLRNLTVIHDTEVQIRAKYEKNFDINEIPENDKGVMKMMTEGNTEGVFQFESAGMKNVLRRLGPEKIEDLIAVVSLYRPGPMDFIPKYIYNRHHINEIQYETPLLEPILKSTYGCIVYQEQVMQIFRSLAGYSLGRADIVRRAMSKKKKAVLEKERSAFIYGDKNEDGSVNCVGAVQNGVPEKLAEKIFDDMGTFSSYAFNKSHAAAYAVVAYQTAYLKCYYPKEYFAALLTSVLDNTSKVVGYINECLRLKIQVLPPHVNESEKHFAVCGDKIRFGLLAIKNLGETVIEKLVEERNKNGKFKSLYDFCDRLYSAQLNRRAIESLVKSGALDGLGANRRQSLQSIDGIMNELDAHKRQQASGQFSLFGENNNAILSGYKMPDLTEMPTMELLNFEKETTGMYLSGHPMEQYKNIAKSLKAVSLSEMCAEENAEYYDGKRITAVAMINSVRRRTTKSDQMMANILLEDMSGSISALVFPKLLESVSHLLSENSVRVFTAKVSVREGRQAELLIESVTEPESAKPQVEALKKKNIRQGLYLKVESIEDEKYLRCRSVMNIFNGTTPVYLYTLNDKKRLLSPKSGWVMPDKKMIAELSEILGKENVKLVQ